jgi:hypothetical protein
VAFLRLVPTSFSCTLLLLSWKQVFHHALFFVACDANPDTREIPDAMRIKGYTPRGRCSIAAAAGAS